MQAARLPGSRGARLARGWMLTSAVALAACGGGGGGSGAGVGGVAAPTAAPIYSVINLAPVNPLDQPRLNARGDAAFSILYAGRYQGKFFDGLRTRDIGSLGGGSTIVRGLNDAGRVVGTSSSSNGRYHAFLWACCMQDLGTLGGAPGREYADAYDINQRGEVVGFSASDAPFNPGHAFLWSAAAGMRDLGTLSSMTGGGSIAKAINGPGQIAGDFDVAVESIHAFVTNVAGDAVDLGTLGGPESFTVDINDAGQVVGNSTPSNAPERLQHAFVWRSQSGMHDLGTLGGDVSQAAAMNQAGQVTGIAAGADGFGHAFLWSEGGGMIDLGTLGGPVSRGIALNDRGQVGGSATVASGELHAFVWSAASGMLDLNRLTAGAPPGLVLSELLALADNGTLLAASNAGLVLLRPGTAGGPAPVLGPITPSGPVAVGTPVTFSIRFTDATRGETHSALWTWGDGSADSAGVVSEADGAGSVSAIHAFGSTGVYPIAVTVTDSAGHAVTVASSVEVQ